MEQRGIEQAQSLFLTERARIAGDFARSTNCEVGSESLKRLVEEGTRLLMSYAVMLHGVEVTYDRDPRQDEKFENLRPGQDLAYMTGAGDFLDETSEIGARVASDREANAARAEHMTLLPLGFGNRAVAESWLGAEREIGGDVAEVIRSRLSQTGWQWVFHVTRVERLASIAEHGIIDSGVVDLLGLDPQGDRNRRKHGNPDKQAVLHHRVFFSFWPPWWLFSHHYADRDVAILAVDAAVVCLQPETAFSPTPLSDASITTRDIDAMRNTIPDALERWKSCWDSRPLPKAEIASSRVHPAHIRHVMFASAAEERTWGPTFRDSFRRSYPSLADACAETTSGPLHQAGRSMWFPPSYLRRSVADQHTGPLGRAR